MNRWDIKAAAKEKSVQYLWLMVGAYVLYSILLGLASYVIVGIVFTGVLAFGYATVLIRTMRGEEFGIKDLFSAFDKDFVRSCIAGILHTLYIFLWSLLLFIPGIVKTYSYSMTYFIMNDDKEISANDAITKSREMMYGHKWELFVLDLSFIGWIFLGMCTFGILLFWVVPYMNLAHAEFYRRPKGESGVVVEVANPSETQTAESEGF